jgi:hypothetical protein
MDALWIEFGTKVVAVGFSRQTSGESMEPPQIWETGSLLAAQGSEASANETRYFAIAEMLAQAESLTLLGRNQVAAVRLREMQAYVERLVGLLAPAEKVRPKLVDAA